MFFCPPSINEVTPKELGFSLSFALGFEGWKRTHQVDEAMARIAVRRVREHLRISG